MLIRHHHEAAGQLTDYFRRLGCTVRPLNTTTLQIAVTHPETVNDPNTEIQQWCRSWTRHNSSPLTLIDD